jgi:copper chaperone CopZ
MAQLVLRIFRVKDIHCQACEERIKAALLQLPGVRSARADRKSRQVEVRLDVERTSEEEVSSRLDYLGFPVVSVSEGSGSR